MISPFVTSKTYGVHDNLLAFNKYKREIGKGVERGVKKAMEYLLVETRKVTPIETGALRASGQVHTQGSGRDTKGYVMFHAPYAIFVHEDLFAHHASGTYAKYLERTAYSKRMQIRGIMLVEIQQACYNALARSRMRTATRTNSSSLLRQIAVRDL